MQSNHVFFSCWMLSLMSYNSNIVFIHNKIYFSCLLI
jgi:hypothetical protein